MKPVDLDKLARLLEDRCSSDNDAARGMLPALIAEVRASRALIEEVRWGHEVVGHYSICHKALEVFDREMARELP